MSYWTTPTGSWMSGTTWSGGGYSVNSTKGTLSLGSPDNYTRMDVWGDSDFLHAETAWLAGRDAAQKQSGGVWNNWQSDYAKIKAGARDDAERRRKAAFFQNDFFADSRYLGAGF